MFTVVQRIFHEADHVRWCSDLCRDSPAFRLAIDDLSPARLRQIRAETETKAEFRDAVLAAWE